MDKQGIFDTIHKSYHSELFDYVLPFWEKNSPDKINGGVFNCLDQSGKVYSTDKSVWAQGRMAWVFSHLCNVYGVRSSWLTLAKNCLDFLESSCIDKADGRMYFSVTADGQPLRKRRYIFSESFYCIACAEYSLAANDGAYLKKAVKYYNLLVDLFRNPEADPFKIHPKTFLQTRNMISFGLPMILLNVTNIMRRCDKSGLDGYNLVSKELIAHIKANFIKLDLKAVLEAAAYDGSFLDGISEGRTLNPGHAIEGSWFILNESPHLNDNSLISTAKQMFDWSIERGWDSEYGGLLYFVDVLGAPPQQLEHDMKLWWPHCEALIAALNLYNSTDDGKYLDWFLKIHDYTFSHFSDHTNGDWHGYLHRDGSLCTPAAKGNMFKSGFHVIRALIQIEQATKAGL